MPGAFVVDDAGKTDFEDHIFRESSSFVSTSKHQTNFVKNASKVASVIEKQEDYIPLEQPAPINTAPSAPAPAIIRLSTQQRDVLDRVKTGRSVFFTGSAGTCDHLRCSSGAF